MPVDRPTFSESWYRVAALRPRLRSTVQIHRQHYRGQMWYVLQDPSNNQFYRQNESAYHFVAMLDGHRTVGEAWQLCNEQLGDSAPTQGEAIQLLGQLYTSNLIQCELPPDAQGLFNRFQKRIHREVKGYLSNLLFIRLPLFDPDRLLDRWVKVVGRIFSVWGALLWMIVVGFGLFAVINRIPALRSQGNAVLDLENLPLLYLSFIFIKVIHEFGHAFACKKFGQYSGGGEVHVMGVMFLVFTPLPYVDASSSWAFRSKWHRVIVGAGGMLVELFVAAIAAVVWARTPDGTTLHAIAYNVMFIASVSTLLFNANPLLRYDGYYILSDLLELPNLSQRAKQYLYYLVRKYVYGVRNPRSPAHSGGERAWFVFYGIASTIYRVFICTRILMFVADKFFFVGFGLGIAAIVAWVVVPFVKFLHYLATSGELMRVRGRAVGSTAAALALVVGLVGLVRMPDRYRFEGVVEPVTVVGVYAGTEGRVTELLANRTDVQAGDTILQLVNEELQAELDKALAERRAKAVERQLAIRDRKLAEANSLAEELAAYDEKIANLEEQLDRLTVRAEVSGTWISPKIDRVEGAYLDRMARVGLVADLSEVMIRCTTGQNESAELLEHIDRSGSVRAEIRVKGRPDDYLEGVTTPKDIVPAGQKHLPSQALSYTAGGSVATVQDEQGQVQAMENFLEIHIHPDGQGRLADGRSLLPGQRVAVRVDMPSKPLISQWVRKLRQMFQRRFRI
ncbi:MAG: hypothetical protein GX591_15725 [Planctomycetes bacterium]|nr:hypothetical protein [Planctomycetota bacterium]